MKNLFLAIPYLAIVLVACGQTNKGGLNQTVTPARFQALIDSLPNEQLVDVRTPEEFNGGFIANAMNMDWNGPDFKMQAANLKKDQPVMVYCLSGGRSASAVSWLRENGFKQVIELQGGVRNWSNSGMALVTSGATATPKATVISTAMYNDTIKSGVVLLDFTAVWCGPCKILGPRLDQLSEEMKGQFTLVKVDVDRDSEVANYMNINAMPTLVLYKDGKVMWRNEGLVEKDLVKQKIQSVL